MTDWSDVPLVFRTVATCPHCGESSKAIIVRSVSETDGSVTRKQICRSCSRRWILIIELPVSGNDENAIW